MLMTLKPKQLTKEGVICCFTLAEDPEHNAPFLVLSLVLALPSTDYVKNSVEITFLSLRSLGIENLVLNVHFGELYTKLVAE